MKTKLMILILVLVLPMVITAQDDQTDADSVAQADGIELIDSVTRVQRPFRQVVLERIDSLMTDTLFETSQIGLMIWDLTDDTQLYSLNARQLMRPASTMKLLTAITALDKLGPGYRYTTSLYYKGTVTQGRFNGDVIVVGGMDPLFGRSDMQAFVQALKQKGITSLHGRIITDCSMKDGDKWGEGWCWDDDNPTLTPLLYDRKANFQGQLLRDLRAAHIQTAGVSVVAGTLPSGAIHLCTRSHGINEVLQQMMKESDNLFAESTFYQVAASTGHRPAKAKDARMVEQSLFAKLGLDGTRYGLADGSGLSLYNYLSAEAQVTLLRYAWQNAQLYQALLPTLPIAGKDGTLRARMTDTPAQDNVQAKTGTVTGISSLAGYLTAPDGHRLCFCVINQGLKRASDGRAFQDKLCIALCQPQE